MSKQELTQTRLRRLLCYNPFSGNFIWKRSGHGIHMGTIAGTIAHRSLDHQYRHIRIQGRRYRAHRLAFLYIRGRWPRGIDHKDRNGLNNSWTNLRECTRSQNQANRGVQRNNKLGIKGVFKTRYGKFRATVRKNGKPIYSSNHDTLDAAALAYKRAAQKYYGKFANTSRIIP